MKPNICSLKARLVLVLGILGSASSTVFAAPPPTLTSVHNDSDVSYSYTRRISAGETAAGDITVSVAHTNDRVTFVANGNNGQQMGCHILASSADYADAMLLMSHAYRVESLMVFKLPNTTSCKSFDVKYRSPLK